MQQPKLDLVAALGPITPVNVAHQDLAQVIGELTRGWGADVVFEAAGAGQAMAGILQLLCPGGRVVFVGMPSGPVPYDVVAAQAKEARVEHVFRQAHEGERSGGSGAQAPR